MKRYNVHVHGEVPFVSLNDELPFESPNLDEVLHELRIIVRRNPHANEFDITLRVREE